MGRVFLTSKQRNALRDHANDYPSLMQHDLRAWAQRTFGKQVGCSTVGKIINTAKEIVMNPHQQKRREVAYPKMEEDLFNFVQKYEDEAVVSDELLHVKAKESLQKRNPDASVSLSWVQKFK
jgi:hypothetical protein